MFGDEKAHHSEHIGLRTEKPQVGDSILSVAFLGSMVCAAGYKPAWTTKKEHLKVLKVGERTRELNHVECLFHRDLRMNAVPRLLLFSWCLFQKSCISSLLQ